MRAAGGDGQDGRRTRAKGAVMPDPAVWEQVNLVVGDMNAAIDFYRRLGLDLDTAGLGGWPPGSDNLHVNARHGDDAPAHDFDLDNAPMAHVWGHEGLQPGETVIGFALPTRDAVDEKYRELTDAGYRGRREPYDAFFGSRYAVVEDPDGRPIGLKSPVDRSQSYMPS
jgi:catechol 2,3-dioxygenase-like lactoylglutathione lyase family enzyme